jgi:hypothetical protein
VTEEKYFNVSRDEILRCLARDGQFDLCEEHTISDGAGTPYTVVLRLNISGRGSIAHSWTVALKLHDTRIDGIDWESRFQVPDGNMGSGWHRHARNEKQLSAEKNKYPVGDLTEYLAKEEFLIRALKIMRITLSANDNGSDKLQFAEGSGT